jgi:hypothetical protein
MMAKSPVAIARGSDLRGTTQTFLWQFSSPFVVTEHGFTATSAAALTAIIINVRTSHVHAVICIGSKRPKDALIALKANATRQLREDGIWQHEHSPWAEKGSKRNLWNEKSIWEACNYVENGQGDELPDFDRW